MIRKIVAGTLIVVFSGTAAAQGAFDFDEIPGAEPAIEVNVNSLMLGFLADVFREADPEAASMLSGLRSIQMRVYSNVEDSRRFNSFIADVTEELEDQGWDTMFSGQDGSANIRVHVQMNESEVLGMTFMVNEGSEAFFINVDGTITAADLGRVLALPPVQQALSGMGWPAQAVPGLAPAPAGADAP